MITLRDVKAESQRLDLFASKRPTDGRREEAKSYAIDALSAVEVCARPFPPPFERVKGWADGAANATPVEGEVDWAVPQPGAGHTANMSHDLSEPPKSLRLSTRPG